VLERLLGIFPESDLYTLFRIPGAVPRTIESRIKGVSFLQGLPGLERNYGRYLPLFPKAVESLPLSGYDLVVSSSYCVAKGAVAGGNARHLCYCHTPMRYVWHQQAFYEKGLDPVSKALFRITAKKLRKWDVSSAARVDIFTANSRCVAQRIKEYYGRTAVVIHPPVDVGFFTPGKSGSRGEYYLTVGALVPYKGFMRAIAACARTKRGLIVVGDGPEAKNLKKIAGSGITFVGWQDRDGVRELMRGCRALLSPGEEDFGIVLAEAQACGRPVIALDRGGAGETVVDGVTGVLYQEDTVEGLIGALEKAENCRFDPEAIRKHSLKYSAGFFKEGITSMVKRLTRGS
jgi:glycosyltransferase involved in cell wall biosynthesis